MNAPAKRKRQTRLEVDLCEAIANGNERLANGLAMRFHVLRGDYLNAAKCRDRIKSWNPKEFVI